MKKYILLSLLAVFSALFTAVFLHQKSHNINMCHSELLWIKDNGKDEGLILKSKTNILIDNDNTGRIKMYGYIKQNNVFYRLDRAIYFNFQSIDKNHHYSIHISQLSITNSDNVPKELFANFIQLEEEKINYYVSITKMDDDIYILTDEAYSSFTCYVEK